MQPRSHAAGPAGHWRHACREESALPDTVARAISELYDDDNIVSAILKIRQKAEQSAGLPDEADGKQAGTWAGWIQRLW